MNAEINDIDKIVEIKPLPETNEIQIRYTRGCCDMFHTEVYNADKKEEFVSDIENSAFGGVEGAAQPYLIELGWN